MLIDAAAPLIRSGKLCVDIVGDGPEMESLQEQATRLGVAEGIVFHGWQDQSSIQRVVSNCTIFGFPSIREFGGGAVLEAMAMGLIPVVVDYAGPGELVTEDTGIRVPLGSRDQIVEGVREAIHHLLRHPTEAKDIARRARLRVEHLFTWEKKAQQVLEVYDWACAGGVKPHFGFEQAGQTHSAGVN